MASATSTDPTTPSHYSASQTALLLLDFHSIIVGSIPDGKGENAVAVAASAKAWAKSQNIEVIHCLIDDSVPIFPTCKDIQTFAAIIGMFKTGAGAEPAALLENAADEKTFLRRGGYVSALKSPGLLEYLREKGIVNLVLTGLVTSGCVLRTAAAACDEEFVVSVLADACADREQQVHEVLVKDVLAGRGYVYTSEAFREGWEKKTLV
ncbi:hypothetical protein PMIN06_003230 [Paraphaeosphaeria minitans]|uniref:Isochorismatase hydrolase n=1 Tax=Paraphaeosphaeria minitans TaxID=565426 RepID=A0A9P6KKN7_9PLEO|nr:isochorismatase hydrolase [Paraphaeosphaeria minitans]